jgi:hypothetical protein
MTPYVCVNALPTATTFHVLSMRQRPECLRTRDGYGSKERMPRNGRDHATVDIKANIP